MEKSRRRNTSLSEKEERRGRRRSRSLPRYCRSPSVLGVSLTSPAEEVIQDEEEEEEDEEGGGDDMQTETSNIFKMSRDKKFTVITFCITNFFIGLFYSILAPFFPTEAMKKGANHTMVGFIFGSYELVMLVISPVYGTYLNQIGANFMFTSGIFVSGVCCILFGFLDQSQDGVMFVTLCFVVRFVEALGTAALGIASFAIMASNFPNNVATMFGTLEMFTGFGMMIGPPVGGLLFQVGGYVTPFAVSGSLLLAVGVVSFFLMPQQKISQSKEKGSMLGLLKYPSILIPGLCLIVGAASIGFLDIALATYLDSTFHLTPSLVGLVFLVGSLSYSIMSPLWGRFVDSRPFLSPWFVSIGYAIAGISYFFVAPAPFLNFKPTLWVLIASFFVANVGISTFSITFQMISDEAINAGYTDSLSTYGLIAGLVNAFFCTGSFIGPVGGGALNDRIGFAAATAVVGCFTLATALIQLLHTIYKRTKLQRRNRDELIPLF